MKTKDAAPGQSEEYPTVDNPTRIMADDMLPKGAVKYSKSNVYFTNRGGVNGLLARVFSSME